MKQRLGRATVGIILLVCLLVFIGQLFGASSQAAIPGDVDGDGHVNATDFSLISAAYLSYPAERQFNPPYNARWDARADFDGSGQVNVLDLTLMIAHYGE